MNIVKQGFFNIIFIIRFNLKLIRAFQYFQRFELNIKYKFDKRNIISNALSRLANINKYEISLNHNKLDVFYIYAYAITLVKINNDFKERILKDYLKDSFWKKVIEILYQKAFYNDVNVIKFSFILSELKPLRIIMII